MMRRLIQRDKPLLEFRSCTAIALDIKSYFESLDHKYIKHTWCSLLDATSLPDDHYAVFKNITKYAFVDQREVYRRLGFLGPDPENPRIEKFLVPYDEMPRQLCTPDEFRKKIAGG